MSATNRVGPIVFSNETARRQLQQHGEVVTFRPDDRTVGETWWRESRTGEKMGECTVERIAPVAPRIPCSEMDDHAHLSGFGTVRDWVDAIEDLHGSVPENGYLYLVEIEEPWAECEAKNCNEYSPEVQAVGPRPDDFTYLCPSCRGGPQRTEPGQDGGRDE